MAASEPIYGWLGDRCNRRNMLIVALVIFSLGSVISALAQSMTILVVGRVIQGLGGGGLMSLSQALIGEFVPPRQRARFQGYFASLFAVSRLMSLTSTKSTLHKGKIDWTGLILFPIMMTSLIYWLTSGGHGFAWLSLESIIIIGALMLLTMVFLIQQKKVLHSFLPLTLLCKKEIYIPLTSTFLFALIFFLLIYLQIGFGTNASTSGLLLLPLTIGTIIGAYSTGKIIAKTEVLKWIPVVGMSITTIAFLLLGLLPPVPALIAGLGFFCGIGLGTVMPST
jgi:MFS family permease